MNDGNLTSDDGGLSILLSLRLLKRKEYTSHSKISFIFNNPKHGAPARLRNILEFWHVRIRRITYRLLGVLFTPCGE